MAVPIMKASKVRKGTLRFSTMLTVSSIPQSPRSPCRVAMPAAQSQRCVDRTAGALPFIGMVHYGKSVGKAWR